MNSVVRAAVFSILSVLAAVQVLTAQTSPMRMETAARPIELQPVSPALTQRFNALHASLQPSAKS